MCRRRSISRRSRTRPRALTRAADRYKKAADAARPHLAASADVVAAVNARLIQSERQLTDPDGLPGRSWYRHLLYAPGFYTGYGVKTDARRA